MAFPSAQVLGWGFCLSEIGLSLLKRSHHPSNVADRGSLRPLWITICCSVTAGILARYYLPAARIPPVLYPGGVLLFTLGLLLRWGSILYLGRLFTVDVAVAADHRVVDTGPYALIRHPSYAGALMAFAGYGICLLNAASLLLLVVPITCAFLRRMDVEEQALVAALGADYASYQKRTKRLVPFVY